MKDNRDTSSIMCQDCDFLGFTPGGMYNCNKYKYPLRVSHNNSLDVVKCPSCAFNPKGEINEKDY